MELKLSSSPEQENKNLQHQLELQKIALEVAQNKITENKKRCTLFHQLCVFVFIVSFVCGLAYDTGHQTAVIITLATTMIALWVVGLQLFVMARVRLLTFYLENYYFDEGDQLVCRIPLNHMILTTNAWHYELRCYGHKHITEIMNVSLSEFQLLYLQGEYHRALDALTNPIKTMYPDIWAIVTMRFLWPIKPVAADE